MAFAKWITAATTALMTVTMAGSAMALSCMQPTIESSYQSWADAPERYYVVSGTLTPAGPLPDVPTVGQANNGNVDTSNLRGIYRVQGEVLYGNQTQPLDHYIWVRVGCAGPWCGNFPAAGTSGVMALKQLPDRTLELYSGACPGDIFEEASARTRVQQCLRGRCADPLPLR